MNVLVIVGRELVLARSALPPGAEEQILHALSFDNPEKESAKREMIWNWEGIPNTIDLWRLDRNFLRLPRGFASTLRVGLQMHGVGVEFVDERTSAPCDFSELYEPRLWEHQKVAIKEMAAHQQGIWQAPTGAGKTVAVLALARKLNQRGLILVGLTNIAEQWRQRAREHLGCDMGLIGDGWWQERDLTVAMVQTLWSKHEELEQSGWFDQWGAVFLDECQHLSASTYQSILSKMSARYRIGVSATPEHSEGMLPLAEAVLGPVFHVTREEDLFQEGILVKPKVIRVDTNFFHPFWPTHPAGSNGRDCGYEDCKRYGRRVHRNNYQDILTALTRDETRNRLIAELIAQETLAGHSCMVLSQRLEHLQRLKQLAIKNGLSPGRAIDLTGAQDRTERLAIAEFADAGRVAIFSTIGGEALDIPRLDRLFLAWPYKAATPVTQRIGRIKRRHTKKNDAIIYDFVDEGIAKGQYASRIREVYSPQNLAIYTKDGIGREIRGTHGDDRQDRANLHQRGSEAAEQATAHVARLGLQ